jgi:type II secretory pathway component GspD/PulD (secretin)
LTLGTAAAGYAQSAPTAPAANPTQQAAPAGTPAQQTQPPAAPQTPGAQKKPEAPKPAVAGIIVGGPVQAQALHGERKAAKLYLAGVKLMEKQQYEEAWQKLKQAAQLEPANATYARASELARESAVTRLVQKASQERARGAEVDTAELIRRAMEIDPKNPIAVQHQDEIADATASEPVGASATDAGSAQMDAASSVVLEPNKEKHSFHLRSNARQVVQDVFHAYGIEPSLHESVQNRPVRLDLDDVDFAQAARVAGMVTKTFYTPLDPHRVIVAQDTRENRTQFERTETETLYLSGLTEKQLTEVSDVAHNVFAVPKATVQQSRGTITLRAPTETLHAFNRTVDALESGQSQVDLNVKVIQLSHISARETGTTFFQQTGVSNAFSEINSIIQQNQSAVQQILASGLVPNASTITNEIEIIAILLSAGQLSGTPFNQGFALFGNGLTSSLLTPGPATLTMSLNSSDTHTLDDIHMQLIDDEAGTFKIGERYPIETSSYSSVALPAITGVSSAAAALQSQTVPQVQYEDIGLTLKATPKVMRSDDVALTLDLKIESLGATALNDIPLLNSQQFTGVLTLKAGETAVLLSDLSRQESRALSGLPGVSDIPGLQDISDIARNQNVARLLILVTPSVVRGPRAAGHGPRLPIQKVAANP